MLLVGFRYHAVRQNGLVDSTPVAIRGNYYRYVGHHHWDRLVIGSRSASLKSGGEPAFKIQAHARRRAHRLTYAGHRQQGRLVFNLQAKLKSTSESAFPKSDLTLMTRKIDGHRYRVIRGYQGGAHFDYFRNHHLTQY